MLFSSFDFIFIFLPLLFLSYALFHSVPSLKRHLQALFLLFSFAFYIYWDLHAFFLFLGSIFFNYLCGEAIYRGYAKRPIVYLNVIINLLNISYYKYANFFIGNLNDLGVGHFPFLDIILPLGISFYTFQQIAFVVDIYKGQTKPQGLLNYALYISFFPHLIAGPIVLFHTIQGQLLQMKDKSIDWKDVTWGFTLFSIGLTKKVLIADNLIIFVKPVFEAALVRSDLAFWDAWGGVLAYTFQLYFDFSGYGDMAVGLGLFFGINFPWNFNSPYKAKSIIEFWRHWHITLSSFLRHYLYLPLGGNRKGKPRRYLNLMITMLLGGLWHGAGWTFIFWGALHGAYLVVNHLFRDHFPGMKLSSKLTWPLTFLCVVNGWVLFRAPDLASATHVFTAMYFPKGVFAGFWHFTMALKLMTVALIAFYAPNTSEILNTGSFMKFGIFQRPNLYWMSFVALAFTLSIFGLMVGHETEFLYFQF